MLNPSVPASRATLAGLGARSQPSLAAVVGRAIEVALTWQERARQRRQLRGFGDHMLRDIGLSRADAENEGGKPFWRP